MPQNGYLKIHLKCGGEFWLPSEKHGFGLSSHAQYTISHYLDKEKCVPLVSMIKMGKIRCTDV